MQVQGFSKLLRCSCSLRLTRLNSRSHASKLSTTRSKRCCRVQAYRVDIDVNGRTETLEVEAGQTILEVALEQGLELSHDCKMGVCMTCPAKMVSGRIDQSAGMLDEDVQEKGYALMCVAQPQSDCHIRTIEEEELLAEVMQSGALN